MAQPFQITNPNVLGNLQAGLQIGEGFRQAGRDRQVAGLKLQGTRDTARINSVVQGAIQLKQIADPQAKIAFLQQRRAQLQQANIDTTDTDEALALAQAGDFEGLERETDKAIKLLNLIGDGTKLQRGQGTLVQTDQGPAFATPVFNPKTGRVESVITPISGGGAQVTPTQGGGIQTSTAPGAVQQNVLAPSDQFGTVQPGTPTVQSTLSPSEARQKEEAAFRELAPSMTPQILSRKGETPQQESERKVQEAAGIEAAKLQAQLKTKPIIEGDIEKKKLEQRLKFKPEITKAVKLAEKEAAAKGDTLTALARSQAALPGLIDAVDQLKELAPIATSTLGGRAFDIAVKESGFGSTKGANARVKFIAMINNQVLPLLRETFGAAFTAQEGESLKATMGDPDATPEQKVIQLDAFIEQKVRDIESKQAEVGQEPIVQEGATATNPQTGEKVIFTNGQWKPI